MICSTYSAASAASLSCVLPQQILVPNESQITINLNNNSNMGLIKPANCKEISPKYEKKKNLFENISHSYSSELSDTLGGEKCLIMNSPISASPSRTSVSTPSTSSSLSPNPSNLNSSL